MPTRRTRKLRYLPGDAVRAYVHGEITSAELNAAMGSRWAWCFIGLQRSPIGDQARLIWMRDGAQLLAEAGVDLPEQYQLMLRAFGAPHAD